MPCCAVANCRNNNKKTKGTEIKYYRFPKIDHLSKKWVVACHRKDEINLKNACICSEHFEAGCVEVSLKERLLNYTARCGRNLKPDAIPTLKLPGKNNQQHNKREMEERSDRLAKKMRREIVNELLKEHASKAIVPVATKPEVIAFVAIKPEVVFDDPNHDINNTEVDNAETNKMKMYDLAFKLKTAQDENQKLKEKLKRAECKIKYYDDGLATVFTKAQIKKVLSQDKSKMVHWSPDDIKSAVALRSVSSKAYRYLRAHNYPLPGMSTLRKWVANGPPSAIKKTTDPYDS